MPKVIYSSNGRLGSYDWLTESIANKAIDGIVFIKTGDKLNAICSDELVDQAMCANDFKLYDNGDVECDGCKSKLYVMNDVDGFVNNCCDDVYHQYNFGCGVTPKETYANEFDPRSFELNGECADKAVCFLLPINFIGLKEEAAHSHRDKVLTEARTKNAKDLEMELASIESGIEEYGPEGFYAETLDEFANKYPEFKKSCIDTFLKEMGLVEPGDDEDELGVYWQDGELIQPDDWACLIEGAHNLVAGKAVQWEKLYKKYYKSWED